MFKITSTRKELVDLAYANFAALDGDLAAIVAKFEAAGLYTDATNTEADDFADAYDMAEDEEATRLSTD